MGEIAEDIIGGTCCDLCGRYFVQPDNRSQLYTHGHPATCTNCWRRLTTQEKEQHQRALVRTI